jgi:hypothetical protein
LRAIVLLCLTAALITGCANVSRLEKGPLVGFGQELERGSGPLYYLIRINAERPADSRIMSAVVKLNPEAPPVALAELRPEVVSRYLPVFTPPPQWPEFLKKKAREWS